MKAQGFLFASPEQPLIDPGGQPSPEMLYPWSVILTSQGLTLAAVLVLEALQNFQGKQLAAFGYAALPLVSASLLLSDTGLEALVIRERRKDYGSRRRIDGPRTLKGPVVMIEDCLISGKAAAQGIAALEEEGFEVEGLIALVGFPWADGTSQLQGLGYKVMTIYDAAKDLDFGKQETLFWKQTLPSAWGNTVVEDGRSPASVAREVITQKRLTGKIPRPPMRFDRKVDGRGGVAVSLRDRSSNLRLARESFWHFDPAEANPQRDAVLAAALAADQLSSEADLNQLKIAVTFFGPLERVAPSGLDYSRFGIAVRTLLGDRLGGALPNTERYSSESEQYYHARWNNARIGIYEPHEIFRYEISKYVEEGAEWLPFGSPESPILDWTHDLKLGEILLSRARNLVESLVRKETPAGEPLKDDLIPSPLYAVAVSLYDEGLVGCGLAWEGSLDECLYRAAETAIGDDRLGTKNLSPNLESLSLSVSLLHHQRDLDSGEEASYPRLGLDSISVEDEGRVAILLPQVAVHYNMDGQAFSAEVLAKAGIKAGQGRFALYPTATWIEPPKDYQPRTRRLHFGFFEPLPEEPSVRLFQREAELLAEFLCRHLDPNGLPIYLYDPILDRAEPGGEAARLLLALQALLKAGQYFSRADWIGGAKKGLLFSLDHLHLIQDGVALAIPGTRCDATAEAALLWSLLIAGNLGEALISDERLQRLASKVKVMVRPDGRVADIDGPGVEADHDFMPGPVLLGLAAAMEAGCVAQDWDRFFPALTFYRRRFQLCPTWGMAGWQPQVWRAVHKNHPLPEQMAFAREMGQWLLDRQVSSGAFVSDLEEEWGPTFLTAFFVEGMASAAALLEADEAADQALKLWAGSRKGLFFARTFVFHPEDACLFPRPERAIGGVRLSRAESLIRIDAVAHMLLAHLEILNRDIRNE